jgi:DNA-binding LacI/PurR family transcriptional regulator
MSANSLKPISPQPGRPLYLTARDALREAIDAGVFTPGEQMPSTKELSEQLSISLVTAHRALQELVTTGVLNRSQGRGTFVHERYHERRNTIADARIALIFNSEASLGDYYHGQVLQGIRQAAQELAVDIVLLRFGEDVRSECNGYLLINPLPSELERLASAAKSRSAIVAVGVRSNDKRVSCIDVDNIELARQAVAHFVEHGHERIAYVGGGDESSNSQDRCSGFQSACDECRIKLDPPLIHRSRSWRQSENERQALIRVLNSSARPTAIFAAGYHFGLDVYSALSTAGLEIPRDVSVIAVDDPPSAAYLSPPLTTFRQPLAEAGQAAISMLNEQVKSGQNDARQRMLSAEFIQRSSTAPRR